MEPEGSFPLNLQSTVVTICTAFFNIRELFVLPTECIYEFHVILSVNSDYFLKQQKQVDLCNGEVLCFLRSTD
jgi:hypothetical protein